MVYIESRCYGSLSGEVTRYRNQITEWIDRNGSRKLQDRRLEMSNVQAAVKKYLFGPVASRRLGISLGVDLVPPKTCSLNCIYCESGRTTQFTEQRSEFVPTEDVIKELDGFLSSRPQLEYITFSGAGEPTLHSGLGKIVRFLKANYPQYKLCLLTNATLFKDPALRHEIKEVDLICPSLDASNQAEFESINRPAEGLEHSALVSGLIEMSRETEAEYNLELFIVPGINDSDESLGRFVAIVREIMPDLVQLNTLDRPGCVDWIKPAPEDTVMRFAAALKPIVPVEAIGPYKYRSEAPSNQLPEEEIDVRVIDLVSRRPSTLADMVAALFVNRSLLRKHIELLLSAGVIAVEKRGRGTFYRAGTGGA